MSIPPSLQSVLSLSSHDSLALLKKSLETKREKNLGAFYEPCGAIEEVIRSIGTTRNLVYIMSAANGIGKTAVIANIAGNIIFGPQNKYFDYPLFREWPYQKRLRIVSEPSQVKDSGPVPTEISKWWPKGKYEAIKAGHPYPSEYHAGDWILEVLTYEQAREQHEGANVGGIFFNEPPPRELWEPNISRTRGNGLVFVGMTPLTHAGWMFDDVIPRHEPFVFYADVEAACREHGIRGHLNHKSIETLTAEYSEEEREARISGKAMYLKGLIFKTFFPNVHVLKEEPIVPYGAQVFQAVDPHSDKPFAAIWAFPDARGDLYIFDEWPNEDFYKMHNCQLTIEDYKKIFAEKEKGLNVYRRVIDRHFADTASASNKRTLRQELQAIGLSYQPSYKAEQEVDTGIEKVRRHLAYNTKEPLSALNQPKLFIAPRCTNTIKSLSRWSFDPDTNKPQDAYKDFCDCVRYLVMDNPKISDPLPAQEFKKRWG